jgi:hypothetical protein
LHQRKSAGQAGRSAAPTDDDRRRRVKDLVVLRQRRRAGPFRPPSLTRAPDLARRHADLGWGFSSGGRTRRRGWRSRGCEGCRSSSATSATATTRSRSASASTRSSATSARASKTRRSESHPTPLPLHALRESLAFAELRCAALVTSLLELSRARRARLLNGGKLGRLISLGHGGPCSAVTASNCLMFCLALLYVGLVWAFLSLLLPNNIR